MGNSQIKFINNINLLDLYNTNDKETNDWFNIKNDLRMNNMIDFLIIQPMFFSNCSEHILLNMIEKYTPYLEYIKENNLPHISEKELVKCTIDFIEFIRTSPLTLEQPRFHEVFPNNVYSKYMKMALEKNDKIVTFYTLIPQLPRKDEDTGDTGDTKDTKPDLYKNIKSVLLPIEVEEIYINKLVEDKYITYIKRDDTNDKKNDLFGRIKGFYVYFSEENTKALIEQYKILKRDFDLEFDFDIDSLV